MIFIALIKLPYNLFCEVLRFALKIEHKNDNYLTELIKTIKWKQ